MARSRLGQQDHLGPRAANGKATVKVGWVPSPMPMPMLTATLKALAAPGTATVPAVSSALMGSAHPPRRSQRTLNPWVLGNET